MPEHDLAVAPAPTAARPSSPRPRGRRLTVLAAVLAGTATALVAPAVSPTTAAAASCSGDPVSKTYAQPRTLVVGTKETQTTTLIVATRTGCGVKKVKAEVSSPLFDDSFTLSKYDTQDGKDYWGVTYSLSPDSLYDVEAGSWGVRYEVTGDSPDHLHSAASLIVRRASRLTTDAGPEPVRRGRTLTVKGTLTRADWEDGKYRGTSKAKVQLQFRAGNGSYRTLKTVTSSTTGQLRTTVKADRDGCYRYRFTGWKSTQQVTSAADCVDVRS
ncbi:hypothetical protein FHX74_003353 [Friedmanniella endophytica]|uniref:Uncharacterized protein n=1 Tax=Microlunatus kandeliicorticis TaxID=1759536 RepID=A0A7W3P786_9ACTN|nr:hypothetical protein [Microlunatus kandeliicorticis]MBA8795717.1 hypothetical protein [Microlunatus kandeliicorticis]